MRTITELKLQNILRIKAVRIKPNGKVVRIAGKNAQGKSSILDGILMVLRGPRAYPDRPILEGEDNGAGRVDLGDIVVTRDIKSGRLVVEDKETGAKIKRPQEFLDSLLSKYTFDPLALLRMPPRDQVEEVKRILGLDFSDLDARYEELYEERRQKTRDLKSAETYLANMPGDPEGDTKEVSVRDLMDRYNEMLQHNVKRDSIRAQINSLRKRYDSLQNEIRANNTRIQELEAMIEKIKRDNSEIEDRIREVEETGRSLKKELESGEDYDLSLMKKQINKIEEKNKKVRANIEAKKAKERIEGLRADLLAINAEIDEIKNKKRKLIADKDIPIDGLEIKQDGLFYNGVPLSQASQSEQIKVGFGLAMADHPDVSVVLVKEASLLDEDSLEEVAHLADEAGFQVWLERVGNDPAAFIIEDGEVVREPLEKELL